MILAFKIGFTAIIVAFMAAMVAVCIPRDHPRKIVFYVVKGCFAIAVTAIAIAAVTLIPAMLAAIWLA